MQLLRQFSGQTEHEQLMTDPGLDGLYLGGAQRCRCGGELGDGSVDYGLHLGKLTRWMKLGYCNLVWIASVV